MARTTIPQLIGQDEVLLRLGIDVTKLNVHSKREARRKLRSRAIADGCGIVTAMGPKDVRYYEHQVAHMIELHTQKAA